MDAIKSSFWITLALCVAIGGCNEFYKRIGENVRLDCGLNPRGESIEWKRGGNRILIKYLKSGRITKNTGTLPAKVKLNGNSIEIPSLQQDEFGEYTCNEAQHKVHIVSAFASPPDVLLGSNTKLHCDVVGGSNAEFQWLRPDKKIHSEKGKEVTLKSVSATDAGHWFCKITEKGTGKDLAELNVDITVTGPLVSSDEIKVAPGGNADLPCLLSKPGRLRVKNVEWSRDAQAKIQFPTLDPESLKWNNSDPKSRISCSDQPLSNNFSITLKKVKPEDAGEYSCAVSFNGGSLSTKMKLIVEGEWVNPDVPSGPQKVGKNIWHKRVLGVGLWIWVAVGASSLVLIALVVTSVLMYRRNKRMKRKIKKSLRAVTYCQCERPVTQPGPRQGRKQRPPPLPRQQYSTLHDYNDAA